MSADGESATPHRLLLLRHAQAEHHGGADHERALAAAGRRAAGGVGAGLRSAGLVPDLVLCSSAVRTRQTWELVAAGLGARPPVRVLDELYHAGPAELLALLGDVEATVVTVLVVGHEPTMSAIAARLAGPASSPDLAARVGRGVPTASCSVLEVTGVWSDLDRATARLVALHLAP